MPIVTKKLLFMCSLIITIFSYNNKIFAAAPTCTVTITAPVNFGIIIPYDFTPETTLGEVKVTCTNTKWTNNNINYTLRFAVSGVGSRTITSGANSLSYNIYRDSAYTQILGTGANGTTLITQRYRRVSANFTDTYVIYGLVPVQPTAIVGNYTGTVLVTLTY